MKSSVWQHTVENLTFQNVTRFGQVVTADAPGVTLGEDTRNSRFESR